ncbi:hypothetical protein L1987_35302 [Smallanthus sonchifolius]|uniref:Uncharacterized protein n=1 Tax=Smallanthus sonchifolius TaxID=185202 RepID=A0ACB9HXG2_9ASTR|nr:hypothetical protein L1987_35302 [Smallanthus sonchifolius]
MFASLLCQTIVVSFRSKCVVRFHIPKVKKNKKKKNQKNRLKKLGFQKILVEFFKSFGDCCRITALPDQWPILQCHMLIRIRIINLSSNYFVQDATQVQTTDV